MLYDGCCMMMHAAWWCVTAYRFKEMPWARLWCPARCCQTPSRMPCDAILRLGISQSCINSKPASPTSIVHCAGWWKFRNWSHSGFEALLILKFVLIFHRNNMSHRCDMLPQNAQMLQEAARHAISGYWYPDTAVSLSMVAESSIELPSQSDPEKPEL